MNDKFRVQIGVKEGHVRATDANMSVEQQNTPVGSGLQFLKLKEITPEEDLGDDEDIIPELNSDSEHEILSQPLTVPIFKSQNLPKNAS